MTIDQIPAAFNSPYAYGVIALLILVLLLAIIRRRGTGFNRAWRPLARVIGGRVKSQRLTSIMSGSYHGHPVTATIRRGGRDKPDTFSVEMRIRPGGRDWEIAYRSEQLPGRETWRASTMDPALQSKLLAANVSASLQNWPQHTVVHCDARHGSMTVREEILAPTAEHFKAQLELLEWLAEVNRQLNGS